MDGVLCESVKDSLTNLTVVHNSEVTVDTQEEAFCMMGTRQEKERRPDTNFELDVQ